MSLGFMKHHPEKTVILKIGMTMTLFYSALNTKS